MGKFKNEIGNIYGKLTVIEEGPTLKDRKYWKCQCECGNIIITQGSNLRNNKTTSCGCNQKEHARQLGYTHRLDLANQKFNLLTPLEPTNERGHDGHSVIWKCKCDCGNICYIGATNIKNGKVKSCGCLKSIGEQKIESLLQKNNIKYEKQKSFKDCLFPDTNKLAKFDFYLPEYNCLIEYDGEQHYRCTNNGWDSDEYFQKLQERDKYKNEYCKLNSIILIRFPYTDYEKMTIEDLIPKTSNYIFVEDKNLPLAFI